MCCTSINKVLPTYIDEQAVHLAVAFFVSWATCAAPCVVHPSKVWCLYRQ